MRHAAGAAVVRYAEVPDSAVPDDVVPVRLGAVADDGAGPVPVGPPGAGDLLDELFGEPPPERVSRHAWMGPDGLVIPIPGRGPLGPTDRL